VTQAALHNNLRILACLGQQQHPFIAASFEDNAVIASRKLMQFTPTVPVDPASSVVLSANLSVAITAGTWTTFFVQLADSYGDPVPDYFDPDFSVACSTDSSAPANSSFCFVHPVIYPQGSGLYMVKFMVGTIWCVTQVLARTERAPLWLFFSDQPVRHSTDP
jgi:hypothetical protein